MSTEQRFLEQLRRKKATYSHEALSKPHDKSEFGYGQATGIYQGLLLAEQLFEEVIGEDNERT